MTQPDLAAVAVRAIDRAGGVVALAKVCGVTKAAVWQWKTEGIPAARVPAVSRATGIPMEQLRPDLFDFAADVA